MVTPSSTCASRAGRGSILLAVAAASLALGACARAPEAPQPNVIFIVLDNVRADRLAQCGYQRPTSPFLAALCAEDRARCTCDAQAPSSWTLPTHASYFTGVEVPQHGAGMGGDDEDNVELGPGTSASPLDARLPTLAERFVERGYQTIAVSGNPLISPPSGLTRGFESLHYTHRFGALYGSRVREKTKAMLGAASSDKPLFLFVNIADAHRPWDLIPEGVGWVPPRGNMGFAQARGEANPVRRDFVTGVMPPAEAEELLAHLTDVYDWAVWRADETLGGVLRVLREGGWIEGERPFRLVITSDHGEHLGEHGLMGHAGPYLYEEITRVPLVVLAGDPPRDFPDQVSALVAYDLLLDGQPRRRPLRATAFASDTWPRWYGAGVGDQPAAAVWRGTRKTVHQAGRAVTFDLAADPAETTPLDAPDGPELEEVAALILALDSVTSGEPPSAEMLELLQALGYL